MSAWHAWQVSAPWFLDELAHAGTEHLDADFVAGYDRKQGHPPVDGDLAALREHGVLTRDATVVDLAAGTGRFALAAAPHCRRVIAVDVSPTMIEHLRHAAAEAGASNVECVRAGFLSYEHRGSPADAVFCRKRAAPAPRLLEGHRADHRVRGSGADLRRVHMRSSLTPAHPASRRREASL